MACASCGGGRQLTPNRQQPPQSYLQSERRIVVNKSGGNGNKVFMKPNIDPTKTKRTQV